MKDLVFLLIHLLTTLAKLLGPGGTKAIVADSLLMKQQLLAISRSRKRAPNLSMIDRFLLGFWSLFLSPHHIRRSAIIIRPSTLLRFHEALKRRKYRLLYTSRKKGKPGPKGPSQELILLIVEMKRRNPGYGCPKIAEQISKLFGININKDIVRRILAKYYYPAPYTGGGPSWLTFIGHRVCYYNRSRPHMSLGPDIPSPPECLPAQLQPQRHRIAKGQRVSSSPVLGGLYRDYRLEAA